MKKEIGERCKTRKRGIIRVISIVIVIAQRRVDLLLDKGMRDSEEQRMCIAYIHTFEGWIQVPDNNKGGKRGRFTRLFVWVANLTRSTYPSTHVALSVQKPGIPGCDP